MASENNNPVQGLDQIREILVGDDRRQYDQRIQELQERLERLRSDTEERLERMDAAHREEVRALLDGERERLSELFAQVSQALKAGVELGG